MRSLLNKEGNIIMNKNDLIIDVWSGNGDIDWNKVKNAGVKGAILQCGCGRTTTDKKFLDNVKGCQKVGIPILGVYHFIYAINNQEALKNAENALKLVQSAGLPKSTVIWADAEGDTIKNAKNRGVTLGGAEIDLFTRTFCEAVKKAGYATGIYLNNDYRLHYYSKTTVAMYDLWLADYTGAPDAPCLIQQYGDHGRLPGISGDVDLNRWIGTHTAEQEAEKPRAYLQKGDKGQAVKDMQTLLTYCGFICGAIDGDFGEKTLNAVRKAQATLGCTVDGKYGEITKKALTDFQKWVKIYKDLVS